MATDVKSMAEDAEAIFSAEMNKKQEPAPAPRSDNRGNMGCSRPHSRSTPMAPATSARR